jgi:CDP-diacylglycerol--serine O-phosphatidyltransferase
VIVLVVLFIALLIAYPWELLTAGTLAYLTSLPFGWLSYRGYERRSRESRAEAAPAAGSPPIAASSHLRPGDNDERPSRLN